MGAGEEGFLCRLFDERSGVEIVFATEYDQGDVGFGPVDIDRWFRIQEICAWGARHLLPSHEVTLSVTRLLRRGREYTTTISCQAVTATTAGGSSRTTRRCCSVSLEIPTFGSGISRRWSDHRTGNAADRRRSDRGRLRGTREGGRRNRYHLNTDLKMRHAARANHEIGELLDLLERPGAGESSLSR